MSDSKLQHQGASTLRLLLDTRKIKQIPLGPKYPTPLKSTSVGLESKSLKIVNMPDNTSHISITQAPNTGTAAQNTGSNKSLDAIKGITHEVQDAPSRTTLQEKTSSNINGSETVSSNKLTSGPHLLKQNTYKAIEIQFQPSLQSSKVNVPAQAFHVPKVSDEPSVMQSYKTDGITQNTDSNKMSSDKSTTPGSSSQRLSHAVDVSMITSEHVTQNSLHSKIECAVSCIQASRVINTTPHLKIQEIEPPSPEKKNDNNIATKEFNKMSQLVCEGNEDRENTPSKRKLQDTVSTPSKTDEKDCVQLYRSSLLDECSVKISKVNSSQEGSFENDKVPSDMDAKGKTKRRKRCQCCKKKKRRSKTDVQKHHDRDNLSDAKSSCHFLHTDKTNCLQQLFKSGQIDRNGKVRNVDHCAFLGDEDSVSIDQTDYQLSDPHVYFSCHNEEWRQPVISSVVGSDITRNITILNSDDEDPLSGFLQVSGIKKTIHVHPESTQYKVDLNESVAYDSVYEEDFRTSLDCADLSISENSWIEKEVNEQRAFSGRNVVYNAYQTPQSQGTSSLHTENNHPGELSPVVNNLSRNAAIPDAVSDFLESLKQSVCYMQQTEACLDKSLDLSVDTLILHAWNEQGENWSNVRRGLYRQRQVLAKVSQSLLSMLRHLVNQAEHKSTSKVPSCDTAHSENLHEEPTLQNPSVKSASEAFPYQCDPEFVTDVEEGSHHPNTNQGKANEATPMRSEYSKLKQKLHLEEWESPALECSGSYILYNLCSP